MLWEKSARSVKAQALGHRQTADDVETRDPTKWLLADMVRVQLAARHAARLSPFADNDGGPDAAEGGSDRVEEGILPPQSVDELAALIADLERFAAGASAAAASPGDAASGGGGGGSDETWELAAVLAERRVGEPHECKDAPAELADAYTAALEDEVFDSAEILGGGVAPKYKYTTEAAEAGDAVGPALRKALMREARSLQGGQLPLHPDAAIFVRQDEGSMAVLRAVITGPVETPYALGLFTFDIFCPPEYPSIAPLVHFCTTAGGTVKFNPNLYHDGKVCLSLIGTFNAWQLDGEVGPRLARRSLPGADGDPEPDTREVPDRQRAGEYDAREDSKASRSSTPSCGC